MRINALCLIAIPALAALSGCAGPSANISEQAAANPITSEQAAAIYARHCVKFPDNGMYLLWSKSVHDKIEALSSTFSDGFTGVRLSFPFPEKVPAVCTEIVTVAVTSIRPQQDNIRVEPTVGKDGGSQKK